MSGASHYLDLYLNVMPFAIVFDALFGILLVRSIRRWRKAS